MNFIQVGKEGKFIHPSSRKTIQNAGIILFTGYDTTFQVLENGLYLRVDTMTKIIQDKTALEHINSIYKMNSHLCKE